ncbi:unnamed protein product [Rotaria sp. Silwood1]|nr:unnamed protein product [Rotaria sp. Silwood1]
MTCSFSRQKSLLIYLLIIINYNKIIAQSNIEYFDDSDTDILSNFKDEIILKQDLRIGHDTTDLDSTSHSMESISLVSTAATSPSLSEVMPDTVIDTSLFFPESSSRIFTNQDWLSTALIHRWSTSHQDTDSSSVASGIP